MKLLAIALVCTLLGLGLAVDGGAQTAAQPGSETASPRARSDTPGDRPGEPAPRPATPPGDPTRVTAPGPATDRPDVNVDVRSGRDDGAALPRQTSRDTPGVFGLSSTRVALLAAALFVVVVLAVVAMTRGGSDTRIDLDHRP